MFSDDERKIFIEYSMKNEKNLIISINAALSFDNLRKTIISGFIKSVEISLKEKLTGDWEIQNTIIDNVFEHWCGIFLSKKAWDQKYRIGFSSEKYGARGFIIGVSKKNEDVPHIEGLLEKVNNEYRQGNQSNAWNWYRSLDEPYENWDNKEILIKMYRKEATDYFTKHIMSIVNVVSDLIDSYMKKIVVNKANSADAKSRAAD